MCADNSNKGLRKIFRPAAACFVAFGMLIASGATAAEAPAKSHKAMIATTLSLSDLEEAFWACDYAAATRGVGATPVAWCMAVTDELKQQKFGGDFLELLGWWRQNKLATHAKLDAGR